MSHRFPFFLHSRRSILPLSQLSPVTPASCCALGKRNDPVGRPLQRSLFVPDAPWRFERRFFFPLFLRFVIVQCPAVQVGLNNCQGIPDPFRRTNLRRPSVPCDPSVSVSMGPVYAKVVYTLTFARTGCIALQNFPSSLQTFFIFPFPQNRWPFFFCCASRPSPLCWVLVNNVRVL